MMAVADNNNALKVVVAPSTTTTMASDNSDQRTDSSCGRSPIRRKPRRPCCHLNNLWSLWYGIFGTALQAYAVVKCLKRLSGYSLLHWPEHVPTPYLELNCSLGLSGAAILLLPFFLMATVFKIGNLANDGFKIGRETGVCSRERNDEMTNVRCRIFRHGGPTAPFVHLVVAFCLLLPKLLMEARLIEAGFLSQDWLWRTDLDFMGIHRDRLVILSFMTANNSHNTPSSITQIRRSTLGEPMPLISNSYITDTVIKTLKDYIGHENHTGNYANNNVETGWGSSVSVEYMNLAVALLVYSIRYPALFWSTNKCLGIIFSLQLLINGLHTLLAYAGMSILYKVQIVGGWKALPLLKHHERTTHLFNLNRATPFLLNPQVTLSLYMMSTLLILSSSLVLYLYGHTRFNAFLNQERERKVIMLKKGGSNKWGYFTHCAALCVLISVGICNAPLLHDYSVLYKGSLDDTTLACIIGGILHLFSWVVIWLFLTIKQSWIFKMRVSVGKATVKHARSLKLITDVDLRNSRGDDLTNQPLLIIGNGRTYNVTETSPKRAILNVIQKSVLSKKLSNGNVSVQENDDEEQIYWLRPALSTPQSSPDEAKQFCWFRKKSRPKVMFDESSNSSNNRSKNVGIRTRRLTSALDEDDGDYATLRELPLPAPLKEDTVSEEGKLLACVHDEHVTYASNGQDLVPPTDDYEDPFVQPGPAVPLANHPPLTPRCLRRTDSGMPHDELTTPRSDTMSESPSPPDAPGSSHSETSSGVHSNDSADGGGLPTQHKRRATSVADLVQSKEEIQWKSCSLQRTSVPTSPPILENPTAIESTVVIRRKSVRPCEINKGSLDPFGRATNMRMTSFMERNSIGSQQAATLPHFPTQPVQSVYAHCSTMPLPQHINSTPSNAQAIVSAGNSCNVYPRQHTTLPTHHNGVKLFHNPINQNAYNARMHFKAKEAIYSGINKNVEVRFKT